MNLRRGSSIRYRWISPGFFRMSICGWNFVAVDTRRHFAVFSIRQRGWKIGPFIFAISEQPGRERFDKDSKRSRCKIAFGIPAFFAEKLTEPERPVFLKSTNVPIGGVAAFKAEAASDANHRRSVFEAFPGHAIAIPPDGYAALDVPEDR